MANEIFNKPPDYSPDNVVGDTLDEVKPRFEGGGQHLPAEAYTLFTGGGTHVPAEPVDLVGGKVKHDPALIIGDTLNEVKPVVPDFVPHVPSGIIGDEPNEIQPTPQIEVMPPPAGGPQATPSPPGHIPAGPQPAPALQQMPPPTPAGPPPSTFEKYTPIELSMQEIAKKMKFSDTLLSEALEFVGVEHFGTPGGAGSQIVDPQFYAQYLLKLGMSMGTKGIASFIGTQTLLYALNAKYGKVFNPAYFLNRFPFINQFMRLTLDETTHGEETPLEDRKIADDTGKSLDALQKSSNVVQTPVDLIGELNFYSSKNSYDGKGGNSNPVFSVGSLVNAALNNGPTNGAEKFIENEKLKANAFFEIRTTKLSQGIGGIIQAPKSELNARSDRKSLNVHDPLANSSFAGRNIPAGFKQDKKNSTITTTGDELPSSVISDDDAHIPLSFTDLRPSGNEFRTVYFRPIITSLSEDFSPSWNEENTFGRVDPVATYQNTKRTISLGFELHAMFPSDLKIIYQKLHWLQSFVYPEYDRDFLMKSGPVVRMRIGDVISSKGHGLGGFLSSLSFDYTDSIWELKKDAKVPRSVIVSLGFTVLHDGPVGLRDGRFGVNLLSDGEIGSEEARNLARNKYRGFGEPGEE